MVLLASAILTNVKVQQSFWSTSQVANEKARFDDLKMYSAEDIIITLPKGTTMFDINYLAVYSEQVSPWDHSKMTSLS